jgi:hypothetical protein
MRRVIFSACLVAVLVALVGFDARAQARPPRFWFCPGPGTLDYISLFEHPEEWAHARQLFSVFKFYQGHTQPSNQAFAPNTYDALARADAFQKVTAWGKQIALELGAVKPFYCTADASGMNAAIADTLGSVRAVEAAHGKVSYIAMDDPFASGRDRVCGGPALEPTADRIATYVRGVQAGAPGIAIGLIDAYPLSSEADFERMLDLLRGRGVPPAFLHMDVDLAAIRAPASDFRRDMTRLQAVCKSQQLPFGILIWGNNPDADALYAADAARLLESIASTFPTPDALPDDIIVQSFAQTRSGLWITPDNLPEGEQYTHTNLLRQIYRRLHGQTGPSTGTAIRR